MARRKKRREREKRRSNLRRRMMDLSKMSLKKSEVDILNLLFFSNEYYSFLTNLSK